MYIPIHTHTVNYLNKFISPLFAAVILFGMSLSAIHIHIDDFSDVETDYMIVEEEFHCIICGSVLKADPEVQEHEMIPGYPDEHFVTETAVYSPSPIGTSKDGRAPPVMG
jgi:hypothetical protein